MTRFQPHSLPRRCLTRLLLAVVAVLALGVRPAAAETQVGTIVMPLGSDVLGTMVVNPATGRLYMPESNTGEGSLVIADLATNAAALVPELYNHGYGTAFDPVRNRIYVTDNYGISVFDGATNARVTALPGFGGVATNPATGRVYGVAGNYLFVDDADTGALIDVVSLPVYNASNVVVNPLTNRIYIADSSNVVVIDGADDSVLATLPYPGTGYFPQITVDPGTNRIYVPGDSEVEVIDGNVNQIVKRIQVQGLGMGIAVNPANHRVYMTNDTRVYPHHETPTLQHTQTDLVVIDGTNNNVAGIHPISSQGNQVQQVAVDPATGRIYLAERYGNVYVFQGPPGL